MEKLFVASSMFCLLYLSFYIFIISSCQEIYIRKGDKVLITYNNLIWERIAIRRI
jgi:hypothetical protein